MGQILASLATWLPSIGVKHIEERVDFIGEYDLIHVKQKHHWDCGVACLEMSVRWWRTIKPDLQIVDMNAEEFEEKQSPLWTIDIFLGLAQNGIHGAVMYTTCKGVHPSHYENSWYNDHLDADAHRVKAKFAQASQLGLSVNEEILSIKAICNILEVGNSAVIILVDYHRMRSVPLPNLENYAGHYIFLVGFDGNTDEVLYLDPSSDSGMKYVSSDILDTARSQPGTDLDVIILTKPEKIVTI